MDVRVDLPSPYADYVDGQVANGSYTSASDYLVSLVKADAQAKAQEKLEAELLKGLEGDDLDWTPELLCQIRREAGLQS